MRRPLKTNKSGKPRQDLEHKYQTKVIEWTRQNSERLPGLEMIYAVPNGGKRSKAEAGKLKREGVKAGVPDLFLGVAKGGFFGLYIEMKHEKGRVSPLQKSFMKKSESLGYRCVVCWNDSEAIDELEKYMALPDTNPDCEYGQTFNHAVDSHGEDIQEDINVMEVV